MIVLERRNVRVIRDNGGVQNKLTVLYVEGTPFKPLLNYVLEYQVSPSMNDKMIQAVSLLLEYIYANLNSFETPQKLFKGFVNSLYDGTIGQNGLDPSMLFWKPRSIRNANNIVCRVSKFLDYCSLEDNREKPINPWRASTTSEQRISWSAWHHKKNNSFMAHTMSHARGEGYVSKTRNASTRNASVINSQTNVKHFPENRLSDLIMHGFIRPGKQHHPDFVESHNLRDILITLLMNAGGLRISEPFHLFVPDVIADPNKEDTAFIRIYHPSDGLAPVKIYDEKSGRSIDTNRANYLRHNYGLLPRNRLPASDRFHAGWKDLMLDNNQNSSATVQWFPLTAGRLFLTLWPSYLAQRALLPESKNHPYAFVGNNGQRYALNAFKKNYANACKRIGLPVAEIYGTNPHGHRHAYGQRLADHNVPRPIIKKAMHHKSLQSQNIYTDATDERIDSALQIAQMKFDARKKGEVTETEVKKMLHSIHSNAENSFDFDTLGWQPSHKSRSNNQTS